MSPKKGRHFNIGNTSSIIFQPLIFRGHSFVSMFLNVTGFSRFLKNWIYYIYIRAKKTSELDQIIGQSSKSSPVGHERTDLG